MPDQPQSQPPQLPGTRLIVQPAEPADLQLLPAWFPTAADLRQWGGSGLRFPLDEAQLAATLAESRQLPPARLLWTGRLAASGEIVAPGEVVAHAEAVMDWAKGTARLARIGLAPEWRGRGLARPFLEGILRDLADRPEIRTIGLNVYTFNLPALRLYERLGFRPDGALSSPVQVGDEVWQSQPMVRPNGPFPGTV